MIILKSKQQLILEITETSMKLEALLKELKKEYPLIPDWSYILTQDHKIQEWPNEPEEI